MPACPTGHNFDTPSLSCRPIAVAVCGPVATTTSSNPTTTEAQTTEAQTTTTQTVAETTTTVSETTTISGPSQAPPILPTVPGKLLKSNFFLLSFQQMFS